MLGHPEMYRRGAVGACRRWHEALHACHGLAGALELVGSGCCTYPRCVPWRRRFTSAWNRWWSTPTVLLLSPPPPQRPVPQQADTHAGAADAVLGAQHPQSAGHDPRPHCRGRRDQQPARSQAKPSSPCPVPPHCRACCSSPAGGGQLGHELGGGAASPPVPPAAAAAATPSVEVHAGTVQAHGTVKQGLPGVAGM